MKYIIDGYNLIHQLQQLGGKSLHSQRAGLIKLLEAAHAKTRKLKDVTVVFDGQSDVLTPRINSTVKVIFTKGKSADEKIKELVQSSSYARDIGVVSDDRQIVFEISAMGAKKISVEEFLKVLFHPVAAQQEHTFKLGPQAEKEINLELANIWLA